jgi:hypothetical protein
VTRIALAELFRQTVDVLEGERVSYLIYGGLALPAWGEIVPTKDVDVVVRVDEGGAARLVQSLRRAGFHVAANAETLFFIDTWFVASKENRDADFALGRTEFDASALARAVRVTIFDRTVPIAAAEDLILYKLAAHRRKDLGHVEDILTRQAGKLDLAYLREWAGRIARATGKFEIPATLEKMLAEQERAERP